MVPRMISAGKASATTIERSRTTNGWRGSGRARIVGRDRARRRARSRSSSATNDAILARQRRARRRAPAPAGRRRRCAAPSPCDDDRAVCPATRNGSRGRLEARRRRRARRRALDDALDVEEVDLARAARPVLAAQPRRSTRARRRAFRRRAVKRVPISKSRTSRRPWRRLCATASTRPGSSDGRSVSNFADSGLATATARRAAPAARTARRPSPR